MHASYPQRSRVALRTPLLGSSLLLALAVPLAAVQRLPDSLTLAGQAQADTQSPAMASGASRGRSQQVRGTMRPTSGPTEQHLDLQGLANGVLLDLVDLGGDVVLLASGSNLGPTVFDSSPSGPNVGGPDPDLLVDRGNLLILQDADAATQSLPGTFDVPDDARLGGRLSFFALRPLHWTEIDLVDISLADGVGAGVRITDAAGRTRSFFVPPGFTEDLLVEGPPAVRTLNLDSLLPQPGANATATVVQDAGFDLGAGVLLEVELYGSGAIADLTWTVSG